MVKRYQCPVLDNAFIQQMRRIWFIMDGAATQLQDVLLSYTLSFYMN